MVTELTHCDGLASIHRYGPALVADAPDWEQIRLRL
jgi:hypothetical protein